MIYTPEKQQDAHYGLSKNTIVHNINSKENVVFWILSTWNWIPTRGSSKKGSHVYFLLQVFWIIPLFDINVVLILLMSQ